MAKKKSSAVGTFGGNSSDSPQGTFGGNVAMPYNVTHSNVASAVSSGASTSSGSTSTNNNASTPIDTSKSPEEWLTELSNNNTAQTFAFNSEEAQKARDWQQSMSDTSHQREVADLKAAGLNPVLSANGGASAYSASSASGSADNSAVGALATLYNTKMNNDNAVKLAKLNNSNNVKIAKINAEATKYASNNSYAASRYASDNSYLSSLYATDNSKYGLLSNLVNSFIDGLFGNDGKSGNSASKVGNAAGKASSFTFKKYNDMMPWSSKSRSQRKNKK